MSSAVIVLVLLASATSPLIGDWSLAGQPFASFQKNGACVIDEEPCSWRTNGNTLFVTSTAGPGDTEAIPFEVKGGALTLVVEGIPVVLTKAGPAAPGPAVAPVVPVPAPSPAQPTRPAAIDTKDPLAQLLLSSAWCSFRYNQTTGYSSSTRVQFYVNATYQLGGQSEGYSSGYAGTFASQANTGSSGKWNVKKSQLFMTPPPSDENPAPVELLPVALVVTRNNNGAPIVVADGTEYSQCQ